MKIFQVDNSFNNIRNIHFMAIQNNSKYITQDTVSQIEKIANNNVVNINDNDIHIENNFYKSIECTIEPTHAKSKYNSINYILKKLNINHPSQSFSVVKENYYYSNPCDIKNSLGTGEGRTGEEIQKEFINRFGKAIEIFKNTIEFNGRIYDISKKNIFLRMLKIK